MAEKTEKPTPKRISDAAKKGQTFKAKDITNVLELAVGTLMMATLLNFRKVMAVFVVFSTNRQLPSTQAYVVDIVHEFLHIVLPFTAVCVLASVLPSLIFSRFTLATEAIKFDLNAINPISGFKKVFNVKALKAAVKALLYLLVCAATIKLFVSQQLHELFHAFNLPIVSVGRLWMRLTVDLIVLFLACSVPVVILDTLVEYFLYYKELKMDRHELKQEHKNTEGNHEMKGRRREVHIELLSEETKANVRQSDFMLANPTHIAIGIYMNPVIAPLPFVSVRETNARALAALKYAEQVGVPVVRDIALARSVFRHSRRYSFVDVADLRQVFDVLRWLQEVERASHPEMLPADEDGDEPEAQQIVTRA